MTDPTSTDTRAADTGRSGADAPRPDQDAGPNSGAGKPAEDPAVPATGGDGAAGAGSPSGFGGGN